MEGRATFQLGVRDVPWLLAVVGLAVALVGTGFRVWALVIAWLLALAAAWLLGRGVTTTAGQRIAASIVLLPILFLLAFEGGWYLIPADLAWLAIELAGRLRRGRL